MRPVMLATDGSPTAEKATAIAIELARLLDTELVVVSVWDVFPAATPFGAIRRTASWPSSARRRRRR